MVVGGQASFVKDKLSKSLQRHGIAIHTHLCWNKKRPPAVLPKGIDLVYICTDMVSHGLSEPCMNYARELGIPYVNGTRKWAESIERLTVAGFPLRDPQANLPDIVDELRAGRPPGSKPTEQDVRAVAIAIAGNVETLTVKSAVRIMPPSTLLAPAPDINPEPTKELTMPLTNPPDSRIVSLGIHNAKQKEYLQVLIANPVIMNRDIWEAVKDLPLFKGNKLDPQRVAYAREQLGIKVTRADSKRYIDIDLEKFMETAEALKVKYNLPEPHYSCIEGQPEAPTPPPAVQAPPVQVPLPPPVVSPDPVAPKVEAPQTIESLLRKLKVAMRAENYTEIHVTPDGIDYKKIVVSEGKFDI